MKGSKRIINNLKKKSNHRKLLEDWFIGVSKKCSWQKLLEDVIDEDL